MKKLTIDSRFWLTAAFCAALLAVPPLAVQARDRQLDTALPRPEVSGVMTDEQRLDPTVRVLYTQQILSTNNGYTIGEENSHKYTQMQGKLRQANRRGLISDAQLDHLVQLVQATEAIENNEEDDYIYHSLNYCTLHTDAAGVEYLELSNYVTTETEDGSTRIVTEQPRAYVSIAYLPNNGPILEMRINCDDLPEDDVDPAGQLYQPAESEHPRGMGAGQRDHAFPPRRRPERILHPQLRPALPGRVTTGRGVAALKPPSAREVPRRGGGREP